MIILLNPQTWLVLLYLFVVYDDEFDDHDVDEVSYTGVSVDRSDLKAQITQNTVQSKIPTNHCAAVMFEGSSCSEVLLWIKNSRLSDSRYDLSVHKLIINHDHGKPQADGCIYRHTNAVF